QWLQHRSHHQHIAHGVRRIASGPGILAEPPAHTPVHQTRTLPRRLSCGRDPQHHRRDPNPETADDRVFGGANLPPVVAPCEPLLRAGWSRSCHTETEHQESPTPRWWVTPTRWIQPRAHGVRPDYHASTRNCCVHWNRDHAPRCVAEPAVVRFTPLVMERRLTRSISWLGGLALLGAAHGARA